MWGIRHSTLLNFSCYRVHHTIKTNRLKFFSQGETEREIYPILRQIYTVIQMTVLPLTRVHESSVDEHLSVIQ